MKRENVQFGNLVGVDFTPKNNTVVNNKVVSHNELTSAIAETRYYSDDGTEEVDLSKFVAHKSKNNYIENYPLLVELTKTGDRKAFDKIDALMRGLLKNISTRKISDRGFNSGLTNDLVQETILKVYESILLGKFDGFDKDDLLRSSVRIMTNSIEDVCRPKDKNSHYVKTRLFDVTSDGEFEINSINEYGENEKRTISEPMSLIESADLLVTQKFMVGKALDLLNNSYKEIIDLRFAENLEHKEIAKHLDISVSNSQTKLDRALKSLKTKVNSMKSKGSL